MGEGMNKYFRSRTEKINLNAVDTKIVIQGH